MATSTKRVEIRAGEYTNVSAGNPNCTIAVRTSQHLRVVVGGLQPLPDTLDCLAVRGPAGSQSNPLAYAISVNGLQPQSEMWVMPEGNDDVVHVVRGPATLVLSIG
jgi:hypothetical protein